jgi:hypothetical protein
MNTPQFPQQPPVTPAQQHYLLQHYPQQHYPQQAPGPTARKPPRSALVGTLLAIAIGVGMVATVLAMGWRSGDDEEKVLALLVATLNSCDPMDGSTDACGVAGLHEALREGATMTEQPLGGFSVRSTEIRCHNGTCEARLRGVLRFGSQTLPATFDFVDDGDGWAVASWADRISPPLIPD